MSPDSVPENDGATEKAEPAVSSAGEAHEAGEPAAEPSWVSIEEFGRLDLRVARIVAAERHPKADRLLMLQVDSGGEARQIVAGIAGSYAPEDLVGRLIVIVANLKPARLRGEMSEGMLLAASDGETISLLTPERPVPPGARVR